MTDKPNIIDGVDVSGCEYYKTGDCLISPVWCDQFYNCDYKQLKRKEQECEELDKELHKNFEEKDKLHLIIDRLIEASGYDRNTASAEDFEDVYENMRYEKQQLAQLKAENEELKKEKRIFRNFLTNKYNYGSFRPMWGAYLLKRFFNEDLGDFFDEKAYKMADTIEEKEKQLDKYSQALTEIKQLLEDALDTDKTDAEQSFDNFYKAIELCKVVEE